MLITSKLSYGIVIMHGNTFPPFQKINFSISAYGFGIYAGSNQYGTIIFHHNMSGPNTNLIAYARNNNIDSYTIF